MPFRIYVDFAPSGPARELLENATQGHELIYASKPNASVISQAERDPAIEQAEVIFGQPSTDDVASARQLKWIQVSSSGITRYDNESFRAEMQRRDIPVCNSANVYNDACAVHALSFMLAQARQLPVSLKTRVPGGSAAWIALRGATSTLEGQRAIIIGYGAIGIRLAEMLRPLNVDTVAYRRKARGDEAVPVVAADELPDELAKADHVINILPDSEETRHFFDKTRFAQCKPGAAFYNIGRGTTVDQEALLQALQSKRLAAAWLDVTDPEPLPDSHPLWAEPNCHITPHIAGGHGNETLTLVRHFTDNFQRFVNGEVLVNRVM